MYYGNHNKIPKQMLQKEMIKEGKELEGAELKTEYEFAGEVK